MTQRYVLGLVIIFCRNISHYHIDAITQIKKHGAKHIKFIGLIAAPEGIKALHEAHPDVDIYLGAQDDHLNENGYIVPGPGDADDLIYGTKQISVSRKSALPAGRALFAWYSNIYSIVNFLQGA